MFRVYGTFEHNSADLRAVQPSLDCRSAAALFLLKTQCSTASFSFQRFDSCFSRSSLSHRQRDSRSSGSSNEGTEVSGFLSQQVYVSAKQLPQSLLSYRYLSFNPFYDLVFFFTFRETNSLVEEFMLLANISVAKKIFQHFPEFSVLRRHPSPPPANYDVLVKAARSKVRLMRC